MRNRDNLETVIKEGLLDRIKEAKDKGQQPNGLVINNDTIQTKVKAGIMDQVLSQLPLLDESSSQLLCYSFTGEGIEVRFRGDQQSIDAEELVSMINDSAPALDMIRAHLGDRLSDETAKALAEGVEEFKQGCKVKSRPGRLTAAEESQQVFATFETVKMKRRDDEGNEIDQVPINVIKSKCKQPSSFLSVALMFNWLRQAKAGLLPLPTLGFTNAVGERAVRYSDNSFTTRLHAEYQTNDVHISRLFNQNGASIIQAGCRICGLWKRPLKPDGSFDGSNFMKPRYYSTQHFLPLFKNAMRAEVEFGKLLEEHAQDGELPTETALRVLVEQMRTRVATAPESLAPPEYPELLKWLDSTINNNPKSFFAHSTLRARENEVRIEGWRQMTAQLRERNPAPFAQRFSVLLGAGGDDAARKAEVERMKRAEADELVNELRNGRLEEDLAKWEKLKETQKREVAERKKAMAAAKAMRTPRASKRPYDAAGRLLADEVDDMMRNFRAETDFRIKNGTNTVRDESREIHFTEDDVRLAEFDVRALCRQGYVKQESDMHDNEAIDVARWLNAQDEIGYRAFIKPKMEPRMAQPAIEQLISDTSKQLGNSLWLVYKIAVEGNLPHPGGARKRVAPNATAGGSTTRARAFQSSIQHAAHRASSKAGPSRARVSSLDTDDDDDDWPGSQSD